MRYLNLVLGFTIVVLVFIAGCSSNSVKESVVPTTTPSLPPSTTIVTTTVVGSPVITPPILTATPSLNPTDTTSHNAAQTIATPIPQLTKIAADDPFVNNIQLHKYVYGLNDCIMKQAFPDIANDPNYGLKATPPKLIGISNEKWNSFYQDFITGKNTGQSQTFSTSKCINFPYAESTTWDMASVEARITARNAKPTNYTIIITISSHGKDVAQLLTYENLKNTDELTFFSWIPIKRTEIGDLDKASINFNKTTNI